MDDSSLQREDFRSAMVWHMLHAQDKPSQFDTATNAFSYTDKEDKVKAKNLVFQAKTRSVLNALARGFKPYRYTDKGTSHPSEPHERKRIRESGDEKTNTQQEVKTMWSRFGHNTTIHGVKQIGNENRKKLSRIIWLVLVCVMASVLSYSVGSLMIEYYQYKTVTKAEIKIMTSWPFPSVTVCNLCPFNRDRDSSPTTIAIEKLFAAQAIISNMDPVRFRVNYSDPDIQRVLNSPIDTLYEKYSYNLSEFILAAWYNGELINITTRFETTETTHGRCFTFNGPEYIKQNNVTMTSQDGRHAGLQFYVNINQAGYFIHNDMTAGVRVYISHHPQTPRIKNDGIDIHPGTSTRVALQPVTYSFLPKPYKSYGDEYCQHLPERDVYGKLVNGTFYSYERCIDQCVVHNATVHCSCRLTGLYIPGYDACTFKQYNLCFVPFMKQFRQTRTSDCDCPRPCTFTNYEVSMSASQMPSRVSSREIIKTFNIQTTVAGFRENFLDVRVYMGSMLAKSERHEPQYTLGSIVADGEFVMEKKTGCPKNIGSVGIASATVSGSKFWIDASFLGGQMGFFLGASLITMAELIETILETIYIVFVNKVIKLGQLKPVQGNNKVQSWTG